MDANGYIVIIMGRRRGISALLGWVEAFNATCGIWRRARSHTKRDTLLIRRSGRSRCKTCETWIKRFSWVGGYTTNLVFVGIFNRADAIKKHVLQNSFWIFFNCSLIYLLPYIHEKAQCHHNDASKNVSHRQCKWSYNVFSR